jgi:hypothetical protein
MKRKWLRGATLALFFGVLVLLTGCGKDGKPGNAYLGVWVETSYAYDINYIATSMLPTYGYYYGGTYNHVPFTSNTYYQQLPGRYYFEYQLYRQTAPIASAIIWGYMTISVEPGTKADLFTDGMDGADTVYDWVLDWYGSTVYNDQARNVKAVEPARTKNQVPLMQGSRTMSDGTLQPPDPALYERGPLHEVTKSNGKYRVTIQEYPYTLKSGVPNPAN